jgi:hypothetical protein
MFENLSNRDYVLIIDKSGSMSETDTKSGSRWSYAQESTLALAREIEKLDPDGITVIVFSAKFRVYENVTSATVKNVFSENSPMGGTDLAPVLEHVFSDYLKRKANGQTKPNGEICIVVTDGQPDSQTAVAKAISEFTYKLSSGDDEYGILFCQVGNNSEASAFLSYLDNNLSAAKFDIVDTKTFDEIADIGIFEALNAALVD